MKTTMTKRPTPRRVKAVTLHHWASGKSYFTVPRTRADYDAMLVQGSVALYKTEGKRLSRDEVVAAVLRSFGITRPKKEGA